jgi:hypothetical protein
MLPKRFTAPLLGLCVLIGPGAGAGIVVIKGRTIEVDGKPFLMRGVCYNPIPIGRDGSKPPHGDFYTRDWSALHRRDLPKMRAMGANCVRVYGWAPGADHTEFLDLAWNSGVDPIHVLIGRWVDPDTDWKSPSALAALKSDWSSIASSARDHPATLGYMVGNELNQAPWNRSLPGLWPAWNTIAGEILKQDTHHLVTTALADVSLLDHIRLAERDAPNLTVWSAQVYRGATFTTLFKDCAALSGKPLLASEFGIDAYNNRFQREYADNASLQADTVGSLWKELVANSAIASGGAVFEWSDEWWKHGPAGRHDPGGWPNGAFPDGQADEEWWGINRVVRGKPDTLEPRAVAETLKKLWTDRSVPEASGKSIGDKSAP